MTLPQKKSEKMAFINVAKTPPGLGYGTEVGRDYDTAKGYNPFRMLDVRT